MNEYQKIIKKYYNPQGIHFESDTEYEKLLNASENGSIEDKKELYQKTYYYICDYVSHLFEAEYMTGSFEDALQDAYLFLKAYKKTLPKTFKRFKSTMAKHIDTCFAQTELMEKLKNWHLNFEKIEDVKTVADEDVDLENAVATKLDTEALLRKASKSNTQEKTAMQYEMASQYIYEGKSPENIAKEMHCTKDQARSNIVRVLRRATEIVDREK